MRISAKIEDWPRARSFAIAGRTFHDAPVLVVTAGVDGCVGRGESSGVFYRGETVETMAQQVAALADRGRLRDHENFAARLPAGGARNALDCALWDLEAQRTGDPVWRLARLPEPRPLLTTLTLGADAPERMAELAVEFAHARALKLKLTGDGGDAERVAAVRAARPDVGLLVDANQSFTPASYTALLPRLVEAAVELIEQPFPPDEDPVLEGLDRPIPLVADESVQDRSDLSRLHGRYDVVNIKLDKCGGLTEAIAVAQAARDLGLRLMVGCMTSTSLAMAPAWLLGQVCDYADLDGPLDLARDRTPPASYADGRIVCPESLWGWPRG